MHFWGQIWVRVKFEGKNGFKTIILIYPENLGHLDIFLSEKGQLKNFSPLPPQGSLYIKKIFFFNIFNKYGLIGDHTKKFGQFLPIGGDFIAHLSWLASVSHFVIDYVTY